MMTRDPNPLDAVLELTAEVERLREELALATTRAESAEYFASLQDGIRVERDALSHQLEADRTTIADAVTRLRRELDSRHWLTEGRGSYEWNDDRYREEFFLAGRALIAAMEPLVKVAVNQDGCPKTSAEVAKARIHKDARIAELEAERDEARAQAARLAEALKLVARNAGQNIATTRWEHLEDRPDYERVADDICSKLVFDIDYINTALASTDSRAWLAEQIAAELERLDELLLTQCKASTSRDYQHGMRVAAATCRVRANELRRKEGA